MLTLTFLMMALLSAAAWTEPSGRSQECREWQECRQQALDAAARQDFNAFHDLAWRTLQAGPKNDPANMTMLARAQSLSGRPGDALVMLQRLASMGVVTDAATNEDFARVRALPAWAEFEARISGTPAPEKTAAPGAPATDPATRVATPPAATAPAKTVLEAAIAPKPEPAAAESRKTADAPLDPKAKPRATAPLTFSAAGLTAVGLAYDAVSGRFIVGDSKDRRLLVVGERSGRLASLAGIDAGFDEVSAFEIDAVEGDLWVVSTSSQSRSSTLHKLQLISGRVLASMPLPTDEGPGRFTDVAVTSQSILVLDGEGRRVYRVAKKGRTLEMVARLGAPACSSLAPAADGVAYAAFDRGILRVDLTTRAMTVVEPAQQVASASLDGLRWIRWYRGSLVAIQADPGGAFRLLRIRFDESGRRARAVDVLDGNIALTAPTSATLSGNVVYYLSPAADGQVEVRKLTLK